MVSSPISDKAPIHQEQTNHNPRSVEDSTPQIDVPIGHQIADIGTSVDDVKATTITARIAKREKERL